MAESNDITPPPCSIGELVDIKRYSPKSYEERFVIEIRKLRGSGNFFPRTQGPDGKWYISNNARDTKRKAFNTGKKLLDFFDEDVITFKEEDYEQQ